jgi:hypothetical protein
MRSLITGVVALAAIVGVELPLALADGSTSPGDTSVFVSKADVDLNCIQAAILCDDQEGKTAPRSDGAGNDAVRRVPSPSDRTCCD